MVRRFGDQAVLIRGLWLLLSVGSKLAGVGWGPDMQETLMLVGAYVWGMRRLCGNRILSGVGVGFWRWRCQLLSVCCEGDPEGPHQEGGLSRQGGQEGNPRQ